MNWIQVIISGLIPTIVLPLVGFLLKETLITNIKEKISSDYRKQIEVYKIEIETENRRRLQSKEVADLLSLWLKTSYEKADDENQNRYELQKKYWELAMILDEPILEAVNEAFKNNQGIKHKEAIIKIRKMFLGSKDKIKAEDLFHWDPIKK